VIITVACTASHYPPTRQPIHPSRRGRHRRRRCNPKRHRVTRSAALHHHRLPAGWTGRHTDPRRWVKCALRVHWLRVVRALCLLCWIWTLKKTPRHRTLTAPTLAPNPQPPTPTPTPTPTPIQTSPRRRHLPRVHDVDYSLRPLLRQHHRRLLRGRHDEGAAHRGAEVGIDGGVGLGVLGWCWDGGCWGGGVGVGVRGGATLKASHIGESRLIFFGGWGGASEGFLSCGVQLGWCCAGGAGFCTPTSPNPTPNKP